MTYAEKFTNAQRQIAYNQGQKAHGRQVAKQQAQVRKNRSTEGADTSKGKVHFEGDRSSLNKTQRASLDAMEVLAKTLGVQIYVENFEGTKNANKNGWYDPKDGSIHININAGAGSKGTMLFTVSHELTHFIRQWSPAKFEVLANFLVKQYGEQGVPVSDLIDAQIADAKADNRDLSREEALEEVVADSMESMLVDGSVIEMMAELKHQDKGLWQKIKDWFKDLAGKIQAVVDAYKGVEPDSTEGRVVADMKDMIGTLEALYMDALVDASENFDAGAQKITTEDSGGVKNIKESRRRKQSPRTFTYKELSAKNDLQGRTIEAKRTVKLTSDGSIDKAWVVAEVLNQCESIQTKSPTPTYFVNVPDIGKNVEITGDGIRHGFIKSKAKNGKSAPLRSLLNARATLDLPQILQNSIEVNRSDRGDNAEIEFSHILIGVTAMEDSNGSVEYYAVRSVVESRKNQGAILTEANIIGKLHAINAKKIGKPHAQVGTNSTVALTHSSLFGYSVADLLNDVKGDFDDTFSDDVYKHFGMTRKVSDFSKNLKFSGRDSVKSNKLHSYAEIEEERQKLFQRERDLLARKREAESNAELLQAMDDYSALFDEARSLFAKRRQGTATQEELDRIEEIKALREERLNRVSELQESLGLSAMEKEVYDIRAESEALRIASDEAWAREGTERENKAIEKAGVPAAEYFRKKALKSFKTTTNFNEAGYMLPDGKLLNFSGGERNHRYRDHREIGEIYEATQGVAALNRFLGDGNIRIMAESPGIDLAAGVEPTKEQYATLRKFINTNGVNDGQFFVDFSNTDGSRAGNYSYQGRVFADRIINDIKYFYENGSVREQSSVASFLHSERDPDYQKVNQALEKENGKLKEDVAELRELVKLQRQVTNGTKFTKTSVEAAAISLKQSANAKGSTQELSKLLNGLYEHIASTKELTWEGVKEQAQGAVDWLWEHIDRRGKRSDYAWENNCHGGSLAAYR